MARVRTRRAPFPSVALSQCRDRGACSGSSRGCSGRSGSGACGGGGGSRSKRYGGRRHPERAHLVVGIFGFSIVATVPVPAVDKVHCRCWRIFAAPADLIAGHASKRRTAACFHGRHVDPGCTCTRPVRKAAGVNEIACTCLVLVIKVSVGEDSCGPGVDESSTTNARAMVAKEPA